MMKTWNNRTDVDAVRSELRALRECVTEAVMQDDPFQAMRLYTAKIALLRDELLSDSEQRADMRVKSDYYGWNLFEFAGEL